MRAFLDIETSSGVLLLAATAIAVAWASSPWHDAYRHVVGATTPGIALGLRLPGDVGAWIDDGLMTVFFLVVGLEIKREWVRGELRDRRTAALPAIGALGGMLVPALIYLACTAGQGGARGWGIPMATDIAFALGVMVLLGSRVPPALKVFLLTLAIVDDLGSIVVIAVFYSRHVGLGWLVGAVALAALGVAVARLLPGVGGWAYAVLGIGLWVCLFQAGVPATLAGVALALVVPDRSVPERGADDGARAAAGGVADDGDHHADGASASLAERLEVGLHPWASYVVAPLFALANAGIALGGAGHALGTRVGLGVLVGRVVGKPIGIVAACWLATRVGVAKLPDGVRWVQLAGAAALAGIGFTVALFVTALALPSATAQHEAKVAILVAAVVAACIGSAILARAAGHPPAAADAA